MKIKPKKNILFSEAEELSFILQGLGLFDSVSYSILENEEGKQILVFTVHEKNKGNIGIGIHMNTEDIASVLLNAEGIVGERKKHNISATAKINKNAWLNLDYNLRIKDMNRLGLAYNISYTDFKVRDHSEDMGYLSYLNNHFEMYIRNDSYRDLRYKFGVQYDWFNNISSWYTTDYTSHEMRNDHFLSCRMDLEYDKMDNREIPTSGVNVRFTPEVYVNGVFGNDCYMFTPFTFRVKAAYSANSRICILPEVFGRFVMGDKMSPLFNNFVGGECYDRYISGQQAFYGIHNTEILEKMALGYRVDIRFRLFDRHYISCIGNYMLHDDKVKDLFKGKDFWGAGLKYSYNSFLGPISATIDYSSRTKEVGFYASAGFYF